MADRPTNWQEEAVLLCPDEPFPRTSQEIFDRLMQHVDKLPEPRRSENRRQLESIKDSLADQLSLDWRLNEVAAMGGRQRESMPNVPRDVYSRVHVGGHHEVLCNGTLHYRLLAGWLGTAPVSPAPTMLSQQIDTECFPCNCSKYLEDGGGREA